jgi:beta-glucanase (GH16 family)
MKKIRKVFMNSTLFLLMVIFPSLGLIAQSKAQTWNLVWHDEFDGSAGSSIDSSKWTAEVGGTGWGNNELEYYTNSTRNASINGSGYLLIAALQEKPKFKYKCWYGRCRYSSARLVTKNKFAQKYGRIETRIKIPFGQGVWPAFWMLGNDIDAVGWPNCGEIDIMENIGREPSIVHGTIHGPGYSGGNGIGAAYTLESGKFANEFHVFAVEWEPNEIRWYVDNSLYGRRTVVDLPSGARWVFDHPFFITLNIAIGGNWPGEPDSTTKFPQEMKVDYVRVYKR